MSAASASPSRRRLNSGILSLLPVLFLALSIGVTVTSFQSVQQEMAEKQLGIARQARNDMDYRISQHEEIAYGLMLSVMNTVNGEWSTAGTYHEYTELSAVLTPFADRGMIAALRLYVPDQKFYSSQRDIFYPLSDLDGEPFAPYAGPGLRWIPTHAARIGFDQVAPSVALMYSLSRPDDFSLPAAALVLYIPVSSLNGIFEANLSGSDEMFLVDAAGVTLAHSKGEEIGRGRLTEEEKNALLPKEEGYRIAGGGILAACRLAGVDWYLVTRSTDMNIFALDSSRALILLVLWLVTLLTIGYFVLVLFHNRLIGETMQTIRAMTRSFYPEQPEEAPQSGKNPLFLSTGQLEKELEATISALAQTIQRHYQNQIDLMNYQMQSLQAQIKPHFLYNTLDIIKWNIVEGNSTDAVFMVNSLSRYLRMSINRTTNLVTLRQETELSKIYLDIMQKRFKNRFKAVFDLEDDTLDCALPRLILQPLMENALLHGLLYCEKADARLQCRAWREGEELIIEVEDNGSGMSPETLERLQRTEDTDEQGLGLGNVKKRLRLFGGSGAAMRIHSQQGIGTCVSLSLPVSFLPASGDQSSPMDRIAP